jgi:type II secretory pathway pseudopilin PulG
VTLSCSVPKETPSWPDLASSRGFSVVETFTVLILVLLLLLIALPRMGKGIRTSRVDRAASLVALTLERSFTLASRQRRPVVVACDCANRALEVRDLSSGDVYMRRVFGPDTEFQVDTLILSEASVTVLPHGVANLPLTVHIASGTSARDITLSTAGLVRVVR